MALKPLLVLRRVSQRELNHLPPLQPRILLIMLSFYLSFRALQIHITIYHQLFLNLVKVLFPQLHRRFPALHRRTIG